MPDSYANSLLTNLINRALVKRNESTQLSSTGRLSFVTNREVFTTIEIEGIGDSNVTSTDASGAGGSYTLKNVDKAHLVDEEPGS